VTIWFSNKKCFPHLFDFAIGYLSVPVNSIDAECSVSNAEVTTIWCYRNSVIIIIIISIHSYAPQRQNFNATNYLALQVMVTINARDKTDHFFKLTVQILSFDRLSFWDHFGAM